jgi:hypothetical protein
LGTTLVIALAGLAYVGVCLYAIVEAARRPRAAWTAVGQSKTLWIVLLAVFLFVSPVGLILAIVFLARVRGRIDAGTGWS